jgi:hypothetical protein
MPATAIGSLSSTTRVGSRCLCGDDGMVRRRNRIPRGTAAVVTSSTVNSRRDGVSGEA